MSEEIKKTCLDIEMLTKEYVRDLSHIWASIFPQDECKRNMYKLLEHAQRFYEDLKVETLEKKASASADIDILLHEAENLRRLLKKNVQLPALTGDTPLLVVKDEIDRSLADLRACLRERREQICELLLEQEAFCEELGETPRQLLDDPLPTADDIEEFRSHLERLKEVRAERMQDLSALRREIKVNLDILGLPVSTETEDRLLNLRQIDLHPETFEALRAMQKRTATQVQDLYEKIDGMRKKLEALWDRLEASPNTRKKCTRHNEYSQVTFDILYAEMQRCEDLKSENIQLYVEQIRREISEWWDKTLKSDVERNRFSNFHSNCYTDDLLVLHEMELEDLKLFYEVNRSIFELWNDRKILWDRMKALESKASEPNRYNNRGGQLLREEKERKTITTKLPKIEQQLTKLVQAYEEREHVPFLVHGENILEVIAADWERKRQQKEQQCSARKQAQTPLSRSHMLTPLKPAFSRNNLTASVHKTPATTSSHVMPIGSSLKRKLNPSEKVIPRPKRSLMKAFNSPSLFLQPSTSAAASKNRLRSPLKKKAGIATTTRRRSGRLSGKHALSQKRRSLKKTKTKVPTPRTKVPEIVVNCASDDAYTDECDENDTYDIFQNCIEPAGRSSLIQDAGGSVSTIKARNERRQHIVNIANENARIANLPKPRIMRTPSKQNLDTHAGNGTPSNVLTTSNNSSHSRKLTTKNLPFII